MVPTVPLKALTKAAVPLLGAASQSLGPVQVHSSVPVFISDDFELAWSVFYVVPTDPILVGAFFLSAKGDAVEKEFGFIA